MRKLIPAILCLMACLKPSPIVQAPISILIPTTDPNPARACGVLCNWKVECQRLCLLEDILPDPPDASVTSPPTPPPEEPSTDVEPETP